MKLTSPAFEHNTLLPARFTCDGDNHNPPLHIEHVPEETKSLALIVEDPDAPVGLFVHWTIWNIDPTQTDIVENSGPIGATEGVTGFGTHGYGGPCPPSGTHRYFFKLFALDTTLDLPETATRRELERSMAPHIIETAELMGLYERKK